MTPVGGEPATQLLAVSSIGIWSELPRTTVRNRDALQQSHTSVLLPTEDILLGLAYVYILTRYSTALDDDTTPPDRKQ